MNKSTQKRQIQRFLRGQDKRDIDAFCVYQWIERCHFEEWWEMGTALGAQLQPNSLNKDYEKRMEFILAECRRNHQQEKKVHDKTMGEIIDDLDGVKRVEAVQLLKKLGIDLDTKLKDIENIIKGRSSRHTSDMDITGKSVRAIIVHGQTYQVRTHKEAYLKVIQFVFQHHPQDKDRILSLQGRTRKYFSRNSNDLTKYRERIPDSDIYAELNENANTLYRRGKKVLSLYGLDHESFEILTD